MRSPSATVIFLHIPRTGGTTFEKIPNRNYGRNQTLTFNGANHRQEIEKFARLSESQRAQYKFIRGHLYFGFHRFLPGPWTYVAFLREPIARALSFYSYARTHSDHYLYRLLTEERLSLKELLERETTHELSNLQTRMIGGASNDPNCLIDRTVLETAKENLRRSFCFVGLTEEFTASMMLLARTLGWRLPVHVKRNANRKTNDAAIRDAQTYALLREANVVDLELYAFARQLFELQIRRAGDSFPAELRRFQKLNFFGAQIYDQYASLIERVKQMRGRAEPSQSA
jgi:hypothetical protein